MSLTHFILASSSPRRRELFSTLGLPFSIHKPDIDETQHPGEAPLDYVQRLSREKAQRVATQLQQAGDRPVLAADTVVILSADTTGIHEQGDILGKPADEADARLMLRRLRGRAHQVCTAITLLDAVQGELYTRLTRTTVWMRPYSDDEIEAYIATGDPFDKAGSYAIQHPLFRPVARVEGCYTNVIGLPMCTLCTLLRQIGIGAESSGECDCDRRYAALFK